MTSRKSGVKFTKSGKPATATTENDLNTIDTNNADTAIEHYDEDKLRLMALEPVAPIDLDKMGLGVEETRRSKNPDLLNEGVGVAQQHINVEQSSKTFQMRPSDSQTEFDSGMFVPSMGLGKWKWPSMTPWPVTYGMHYNPCAPPFPPASRWPKGSIQSKLPKAYKIEKEPLIKVNPKKVHERPIEKGWILSFSRTKGYGWVISDWRTDQPMTFHVADVQCDYVPKKGDRVFFRVQPMPPKNEKLQAYHLRIVEFGPGVHAQWKTPVSEAEKVWTGKVDYMIT